MERYKVTHRMSPLKIRSEQSEMIINEQIDDLVEMIEDHCLMVSLDFGKSHTKLEHVRSWANLSDKDWEKMIEQLKNTKILGTPLLVNERFNKTKLTDELILSWGFRS